MPVLISFTAFWAASASFSSTMAVTLPLLSRMMRPKPVGVVGHVGQQADFVACGFEQGFEGGCVNQGDVAVQHQRAAFGRQVRQGGFDGVAGTELFGLFNPNDIAFDGVQDLLFAVADDDADVLGIQ